MASTTSPEQQVSRRRFQRFPLRVPAVFSWKSPRGARQKGEGLTRDISADGVFIVADCCPPSEAVIEFEVRLPALDTSGPPLRIRAAGHVVRTDGQFDKFLQGFAVHSNRKFVLRKRTVWNPGTGVVLL